MGNERVKFATLVKTVAATGTPEAVSATAIWVKKATFLGKKAFRTDNTSTCFLGTSSTNDEQPFQLPAGGEVAISAAEGCEFNLADWYIDVGTNADGVVCIYH